jgi:cytochrome c peroxidase
MSDQMVLLLTGAGAVVVGLTAATLIVWRDLAPVARLSPVQRVALIVALGGGVIAFGLKLTVIETLSLAGRDRLAPTLAAPVEEAGPPVEVGRPVWSALPREAPAPADNPTTAEKVALGRRPFFDTRLSRDGSLSCASCHDLDRAAGGDGRATALGIDGQVGPRNTPTVYNAAFQARLFWDGRATSLEEQALGPIANPIEMGADLDAVAAGLAADPTYRAAFAAAFGEEAPIDRLTVARALAAFERTLVTPDAPFDRLLAGDVTALTPQQLRGMSLFETVGCIVCHAGPAFSRASLLAPEGGRSGFRLFPALASPIVASYRLTEDRGAARSGTRGLWRVPSLRNVAVTGPRVHNGAVTDLAEAVRIMATVQAGRVVTDGGRPETVVEWSAETRRLTRRTPSPLSEAEVADIVAFLGALTSDRLARR